MKSRIACVVASAVLALSASSSASAGADESAAKAVKEAEQPKSVVAAKDPSPSQTAPGSQQNKMKHCNEEARKKEMKGDERRAFMSSCLKG